jgi:hypothetical protein
MASLFISGDLTKALKLKVSLGCPHIHFVAEEDCDLFTSEIVWGEVLFKGLVVALNMEACVVSYTVHHTSHSHMDSDDLDLLLSQHKNLAVHLREVDVYHVR